MKKKIFLAMTMIAIISLVCFAAFADTIEESGDTASTSVYATIDEITPVYSVTVTFGDMEFSYSPEWKPDAEGGPAYEGGLWDPAGSNMILVTNKSNVAVDVSFSYTQWDDSFSSVDAAFNVGEFKDSNWAETKDTYTENTTIEKYDSDIEECSICAFLNLSGDIDPADITEANTKIGFVTVTASEVEAE